MSSDVAGKVLVRMSTPTSAGVVLEVIRHLKDLGIIASKADQPTKKRPAQGSNAPAKRSSPTGILILLGEEVYPFLQVNEKVLSFKS